MRSYRWAPHRRILYAAYPVRGADGQVTNVVYIASPLPRLTLSMLPDYAVPHVLGGASVAGVLAGLAGVVLARQLTQPLQQLTTAASALARGDPAGPIPPAPSRELDALGRAFNAMNANLAAAHDALAVQAHQREAILNSLTDAVLAFDAAGRPVVANPAARALEGPGQPALDQAVEHTLATGELYTTELMVRGRVVALAVTPLQDETGQLRGAVAVGHDVTAYRQLDGLRTRFVSDVSHELRTPLTAIKGTVETLQDGAADDPAAREQFLATVARETERLIRLTNDLLLLTRADAGRLDLRRSPVDVASLARRVITQFAGPAQLQHISLTAELPVGGASVLADEDRVYQVLVNLLDNALKFTPAGGRITLSLSGSGGQVACTVSDTGPGLPAEELPQLFERFYRGDRARARGADESGAGLGLAIVKALIEAQGGHVWAESAPHEGTAVTFTLPAGD
jgi:signal transduction histidine kinase